MARVKGEGDFLRAIINPKKSDDEYKKALIPLSLTNNNYCEGEFLASILLRAIEVFDEVTVLLVDEPQASSSNLEEERLSKFDSEIEESSSELCYTFWEKNKSALEVVFKEGSNLYKKYTLYRKEFDYGIVGFQEDNLDEEMSEIFTDDCNVSFNVDTKIRDFNERLTQGGIPMAVIRWKDWLNTCNRTEEFYKNLYQLYETDETIKHSLEESANEFLMRRKNELTPTEAEEKKEASFNYLKKEGITPFIAGCLGYCSLVYPAKPSPMFSALLTYIEENQDKEPFYAKPVDWLTTNFQRYTKEKVQNSYKFKMDKKEDNPVFLSGNNITFFDSHDSSFCSIEQILKKTEDITKKVTNSDVDPYIKRLTVYTLLGIIESTVSSKGIEVDLYRPETVHYTGNENH